MRWYAQRIQTPRLVNMIAMEKRVIGKERCHTATLRSKLNIYADGRMCERTCGGHINSTRVRSPRSRTPMCHHYNGRDTERKKQDLGKRTRTKMSHTWRVVRERHTKQVVETYPAIYFTHQVKPNKILHHLSYGSHPTSNVKLFGD